MIKQAAETLRRLEIKGIHEVALVFTSRAGAYTFGILRQSLLAYILLPEGRGSYAVCVTFAVLIGLVFSLGFNHGVQYRVMAKRISVSQSLFFALTACLVASFVAVAVALPLIHSDLAFFQKADTSSFYLALILIPSALITNATELLLLGLKRFFSFAVFLLLQSITVVLGIVILTWGLNWGVNGAILALAAGHVVMITFCLRDLCRNYRLAFEMPSLSKLHQVFSYGLRDYAAQVGIRIELGVGILALGMLAGRADIGLFAAASVIMMRLGLISTSVETVLLPRVASGAIKNPEAIGLHLRLVSLMTGIVLAIFLAVSVPLVRLLLSEAFVSAVPLMWILAPGILAHAGTNIFTAYFHGVNCPGLCSWSVWLGLSVNVLSLWTLYPAFGIKGVAWAMTIGLITRAAFLIFMFRRATGMTLGAVWLPRWEDFDYPRNVARGILTWVGSARNGGS